MLGWRNRGRTQYEELLFAQGLSRANIWQLLKISKLPSTTLVKQTLRTKIRFYESFPCNELSMINTAYKEGAHCQARQRKRNATARNGLRLQGSVPRKGLKTSVTTAGAPEIPAGMSLSPNFTHVWSHRCSWAEQRGCLQQRAAPRSRAKPPRAPVPAGSVEGDGNP